MAPHTELQQSVAWDLKRLTVPDPDVHASDDALGVLDKLDDGAGVERVVEYAGDQDRDQVATADLLRVLQLADGALALVTWTNIGITAIGFRPVENRFDIGEFSGRDKRMGKEYESYDRATRAEVKDKLQWCTPTLVTRAESKQLPPLDGPEVAP